MQFLSQNEIIKDKEFLLDENESFHLRKVLRINKGDLVKVFDGKKKWECVVVGFKDKYSILKPVKEISESNNNLFLNLYFPFIEKKHFEEVIRKGVEVGVCGFYPLVTDYTQKNFIFDIKEKKERFDEIIKSSVKQSERSFIPLIFEPMEIDKVPFNLKKFILMTPKAIDEKLYKLLDILDFIKKEEEINIIVGPEGGFSKREIDIFSNFKDSIIPLKISYNILRVETASIISCASILAVKVKNEDIV
jgi:16S rRNA (uracil1498-N3)-methyltransferase